MRVLYKEGIQELTLAPALDISSATWKKTQLTKEEYHSK
jgi:hypothetical protein